MRGLAACESALGLRAGGVSTLFARSGRWQPQQVRRWV